MTWPGPLQVLQRHQTYWLCVFVSELTRETSDVRCSSRVTDLALRVLYLYALGADLGDSIISALTQNVSFAQFVLNLCLSQLFEMKNKMT